MTEKLKNTVYIFLAVILVGACSYFCIKYILPPFLPFITAYIIYEIISPLTKRFKALSCAAYRVMTVIVLSAFCLILAVAVYFLLSVTATQLVSFFNYLTNDLESETNPLRSFISFFTDMRGKFPKLSINSETGERIYEVVSEIIKNATVKVSTYLANGATKAASKLPSFLISFFVSVTALFYIALDKGELSKSLRSVLTDGVCDKILFVKDKIKQALCGYMKAYLTMMLIVFAELYLGLTVIGIQYSLVIALIIAFVDLLPVLGVGSVLIPWSVISFISGDTKTGIGLLVLFGIMTVVRELAEPHIIGSYIGVHPLLALISVYCGMRFFGFFGLVFAPVAIYTLRSFKDGRE